MLSFKLICKRHGRVSLLSLSSILSSISISSIPPILFHSLFHSPASISILHCLYTARSASEINHWLLIQLDTLRPHSQLTRSELRGHHRGARRRVRRRDHHEELERTKENWSTDRWSSAARRVLADENILNQPDCLRVVSYLRFVRLITRKLLENYSVCESYESRTQVGTFPWNWQISFGMALFRENSDAQSMVAVFRFETFEPLKGYILKCSFEWIQCINRGAKSPGVDCGKVCNWLTRYSVQPSSLWI